LVFSAGDQRWFERRWQLIKLLAEAGWLIGVSLQPMLEPIVLTPDFLALARWCICGGEQSPGYREMDPDWARSLLRQCKGANPLLPIFVKQMARGWLPPDLLLFREFPQVC
jgi:protein gp37